MSTEALRKALSDLEAWIDQEDLADDESLDRLKRAFDEALATSSRDGAWEDVVRRARQLEPKIQAAVNILQQRKETVREALSAQGQGGRALKAYGASVQDRHS